MSLVPASSRGGGGSQPSQWTVGADGSLTITISDSDGLLALRSLLDGTAKVESSLRDGGGGTVVANLSVRGKGSGTAVVSVDGQTPDGEIANLYGYGGLELFTEASRKAIAAWDGPGNTLRFALLPAGQPMIGVLAAPADGDISAGQCALWFDDTDGAAALKLKGKQADGTVVTATVPLTA